MQSTKISLDQLINKADRLCAKKKYHEAVQVYHQALQQGAEDVNVYNNLSVLYSLLNQPQKSIEAYQHALRIEPTVKRCNQLVQDLSAANAIPHGIHFFSSLEHPIKHYGLSLCYFTQNDGTNFIEEIKKGIHFLPEVAAFYKILGRFYYQNNEFNGSLKALEKGLQLDPKDTDILIDLGNTLLCLKKSEVAIKSYQHALHEDGNNPYIYKRILRSAIEKSKDFPSDFLTSLILHGLNKNLLTDEQTLVIFRHKAMYAEIEKRFIKRVNAIRFNPPGIKPIILDNTPLDFTNQPSQKQGSTQQEKVNILCELTEKQKGALSYEQAYTHDALWLPRPNAAFEYYNITEKSLLSLQKNFSDLYTRRHSHESSKVKTHRIGIYCDRSLSLFIKHFHRLLEQWDDPIYSITLISFIEYKPRFDLFKKQHPNTDKVDFLPIYNDRGIKFNFDLLNGQFDLIYYFEFNTTFLNYFIPMLKPAPIQCTGHGICHSTGLPEMDYFLVPAYTQHVKDSAEYYTEKLMPVDHLFLTPADPSINIQAAQPETFDLPSDRHLYLCHHRHVKFTPEFIHAIKMICEKDANASILLTMGTEAHVKKYLDNALKNELKEYYDTHIFYLPYLDRDALLSMTALTHLMLDSFFFGAGTTSLEAISVGVPIVTLPDSERTQATHFTHYLYEMMGAQDVIDACVAYDANDYVNKAVRLGQDPVLQETLKKQLLQNKHKIFDCPEGIDELKHALVYLANQHSTDNMST